MSDFVALSECALSICAVNYGDCGKKNGCEKCPIANLCRAALPAFHISAHNQHVEKINAAAAIYSGLASQPDSQEKE